MSPGQLASLRQSLEKAAALNVVPAQLALGHSLREVDPSDALKWFLAAADQGDSEAMAQAGQMLASGKGVARDPVKAVQLWERSANLHDPAGLYFLGESYLRGKVGLDVNPKKAVDLLAESASVKNVYAMALLADANRRGIPDVLPQNIDESVRLYREAGDLGFLDAKANLGVLYINGEGVPKDEAKAVEIFREGTLKNNALSMFLLAQCLERGVGVAPDANEARAWYMQAASRGNPPAIAWCQKRSIPVPPAPKDANSSGL
jgi:TPR repeat protein